MKNLVFAGILLWIVSCTSTKPPMSSSEGNAAVSDTVRIANEELQYEVIIIDGGFNTWLATNARPRNYYSQPYLENRNRTWVIEWNNRVRFPRGREVNLFQMPIDYQNGIDYGYEVNYLLYNYLTYFQITNNIALGGFTPRI